MNEQDEEVSEVAMFFRAMLNADNNGKKLIATGNETVIDWIFASVTKLKLEIEAAIKEKERKSVE